MAIITHYTKLKILLNNILENFQFKMNLLSKTNDPYEYSNRFMMATSTLESDYKDHLDDILKVCNETIRNRIKVGCFVAEEGDFNDYKTWNSVLNAPLWSHYGENNEGVALVIDLDGFVKACKKNINYDWAFVHDKMEYPKSIQTDSAHLIVHIDDIEEKNEIGYAKFMFDRAKQIWYKKNIEWSYENEYRIMVYTYDSKPYEVNILNCLKAVVFGERVSKICKQIVGEFCNKNNIKPFFVEFNQLSNKYTLYEVDFAQPMFPADR